MNDQQSASGDNVKTASSDKVGKPRSRRKKDRRSNFDKQKKAMLSACESMLDDEVVEVAYPGGKSRDAVALILKSGAQAIAAVRKNRYRAGLEHRVLDSLSSRGAPVPRVLGFDGETLLIQELLEGERLSLRIPSKPCWAPHWVGWRGRSRRDRPPGSTRVCRRSASARDGSPICCADRW